jgi:hypothetical protein
MRARVKIDPAVDPSIALARRARPGDFAMEEATYVTLCGKTIPVKLRRRRPYAALALRCGGAWFIFVMPLILMAVAPSTMWLHDFMNLIASCLGFSYVGFMCLIKARDLTPPTLERALADPRGAVLYLRNFAADEKTKVGMRDLLLLPLLPSWSFRGKELHIRRVFGEYGPLIAIGKPGDRTPPIGAFRIFVNDEWQELVVDLMNRSQLVIIRAALGPGLEWELQQVARRVSPHRVVLFLPYRRSDWQRKCEEFGVLFDRIFPAPLLRKNRSPLVIFDHEWRSWSFRDRWPGYLPPKRSTWFRQHVGFHGLCDYKEQLALERLMLLSIVAGTSISLIVNGFFGWIGSGR